MAVTTPDEYMFALQGLLPHGPAWSRDADAPLTRILSGLSAELSRLDDRADRLIEESDPRSTFEMLPDWERIAGLPDACALLTGVSLNVAQRQVALAAKLTSQGGSSIAYFIALAARLGFTVTITEFREWSFDSDDDTALSGSDWAYAWQVNAPLNSLSDWTFDSDDDTPFAWWGNQLLECALSRYKPAHTTVIFSYT